MGKSLDRMRDERIKALIKQVDLRRESDMAEARKAPPRRAAAQTRLRRHGPAMSERDDAGCWLPIIGLCITIPVWRAL
jgi:hypothetical protein